MRRGIRNVFGAIVALCMLATLSACADTARPGFTSSAGHGQAQTRQYSGSTLTIDEIGQVVASSMQPFSQSAGFITDHEAVGAMPENLNALRVTPNSVTLFNGGAFAWDALDIEFAESMAGEPYLARVGGSIVVDKSDFFAFWQAAIPIFSEMFQAMSADELEKAIAKLEAQRAVAEGPVAAVLGQIIDAARSVLTGAALPP